MGQFRVDDVVTCSFSAGAIFDRVEISLSGPGWRPDGELLIHYFHLCTGFCPRLPFAGRFAITNGPVCGPHVRASQKESIDYGLPRQVPVLATEDGVVAFAGRADGPLANYGRLVVIQHPNGNRSLYAHLNVITVTENDSVTRGQPIGTSGATTGTRPIGPHLHFQVRDANGQPVSIRDLPGTLWLDPDPAHICQPRGSVDGYAVGAPAEP